MAESRGPGAEDRGPEEGKTSLGRKQAFAPLTTMIPTPSSGTEADTSPLNTTPKCVASAP